MSDSNSSMMLVVVSMMILSSCVSSSMSSGLFVAANENWLTGTAFDWMDWTGWNDFKSWFGFGTSAGDGTGGTGGETGTGGDTGTGGTAGTGGTPSVPTSKYKDNCVYLYTGKDATSGYLKTVCVDEKNPNKHTSWTWKPDTTVQSLRVGKEVKASITGEKYTTTSLTINGQDVSKPVNLSDKDFRDRAGGISVSYKSYSTNGTLQNVGGARDENCVYVYNDDNGNGYLDVLCTKKSGSVESTKSILKRASSLRIGKNVTVTLYGAANPLVLRGSGTKNLIKLTTTPIVYNDKVKKIVAIRS